MFPPLFVELFRGDERLYRRAGRHTATTEGKKDMKPFAFYMMVVSAMALVGTAWAGSDKEEPRVRLELDLIDGSHIIGVSSIESVPVEASYAKMNVALKQILMIKIGDDHETASIDLRNGDKLKGVISLPPIQLEALFGSVRIGIEHVREVRVVLSGGELPDVLRKGMILYYSFDRDEGKKVSDQSGTGNDGEVDGATWTAKGIKGGAYAFDGTNDLITVKPRSNMSDTGDTTVSLWTYARGRKPTGDRQFIFDSHSDATSGQYRQGVCLLYDFFASGKSEIHNAILYDSDVAKCQFVEQATPVEVAGQWHHMVFVKRGKDDCTYFDGKRLDSSYAREVRRDNRLDLNHTWSIGTFAGNKASGNNNNSFNGLIDEVMVYDRALAGNEVEQIYDAQK